LNIDQMQLLHRHGNDWQELKEIRHAGPDESDIERRLLRGERVFRCTECDLEIIAVPPRS
jgi:hypothetical protein